MHCNIKQVVTSKLKQIAMIQPANEPYNSKLFKKAFQFVNSLPAILLLIALDITVNHNVVLTAFNIANPINLIETSSKPPYDIMVKNTTSIITINYYNQFKII